jgi:hypothetical protein
MVISVIYNSRQTTIKIPENREQGYFADMTELIKKGFSSSVIDRWVQGCEYGRKISDGKQSGSDWCGTGHFK